MTTDLTDTVQRLADLVNLSGLVTKAFVSSPAALGDLPATLFFVGQQQYTPYKQSEDLKIESTTIYARTHVASVTTGIPGEVEDRCKELIPQIRDLFLMHPGLAIPVDGPLKFILRSSLENSTGVKVFIFNGQNFAGFQHQLTIDRLITVTYPIGELNE